MLFSYEAEQAVLGACMGWPEAYSQIQGALSSEHFHRPENRRIFRAIEALSAEGKAVDPVTVGEWLEGHDDLQAIGGLAYLVDVTDNTPSAANVVSYAQIVRKRALKRRLGALCEDIIGRLQTQEPEDLISNLQGAIDNLTHSGIGSGLDWIQVLLQADETIQESQTATETGDPAGIPTGLPALDRRIGGLPKKRLIIFAGRPSLGKTAFAMQAALNAARRGHGVGICSLEMGADELGIRAYANVLGVNGTGLQFGDKDVLRAWNTALADHLITRYPLWVDDSTYSLSGIVARAHEWKHKHNISLLVVDHIGLVELDANSPNERLGEVTRTLKKLAKRLDIPVLAVCQLNRNVERERRRPKLSDLRDSGNIEQDCDVALFLHAEDVDDEDEGHVEVEIGALKTRYGKRGWLPQRFQFDGRTQRFKERIDWAGAA